MVKQLRAMDVLFPVSVKSSEAPKEERYGHLMKRMEEMHIPVEEMDWFLDTRRFGSVPHAGFGLGFERLVQFVTGMSTSGRHPIP